MPLVSWNDNPSWNPTNFLLLICDESFISMNYELLENKKAYLFVKGVKTLVLLSKNLFGSVQQRIKSSIQIIRESSTNKQNSEAILVGISLQMTGDVCNLQNNITKYLWALGTSFLLLPFSLQIHPWLNFSNSQLFEYKFVTILDTISIYCVTFCHCVQAPSTRFKHQIRK